MVPLLVIGSSILVFDVGHVRYLREHGIVGVLSGSLPKAPQQNVFLGIPLHMSIYEAVWSVHAGIAFLVDGLRYSDFLANENPKSSAIVTLENSVLYAVTLDTHRPKSDADLDSLMLSPELVIKRYCEEEAEYGSLRDFWCNYHAFKFLREKKYFMMPGLRFGGAFVAYPGDPLKFHSHLIVKVLKQGEIIDLLKIVTSGRLATAVKKAWLLISEESEENQEERKSVSESPKMQAFSIEWAGFG